jgi:hypothetical protein
MKRNLPNQSTNPNNSGNKNVHGPETKKPRLTRNSNTKVNAGQFKSNLVIDRDVQCRVPVGSNGQQKKWVQGVVSNVELKAMLGNVQCKKKVRIEYMDDDGYTKNAEFWSKSENTNKGNCIEGNVIVVDPVRELLEHEGGSRSYIYRALQRFMPRAVKDKWKEIVLNNESTDNDNFDFVSLFDHMSESASSLEKWKLSALEKVEALESWKVETMQVNESERSEEVKLFLDIATLFEQLSDSQTRNSFALIQNEITKDEYTKNLINTAAGSADAHKDILYTIAHVVGVFMAIELNHLDGKLLKCY